jgi:alpha-amylase
MSAIVFYFHAHQPFRIKPFNFFSLGNETSYYDETKQDRLDNTKILKKVARKCYLPTNKTLLHLLKTVPDFHISFSLTGVFLEQIEQELPEVLESFQELVATGKVELVAETYYHSLAFLESRTEFNDQVHLHEGMLKRLFGVTPTAFRNTELIYNNDVAQAAFDLGYRTILAEGVDRYLGWRSPNFVYQPTNLPEMRLMLKNYRLSDDIAFRFSNKSWHSWPLKAETYAHWLSAVNGAGHVINLFMDYETFGEHQWEDTGIFEFLKALPHEVKKNPDNTFMTVSQAAHAFPVMDTVDMPDLTSWADLERDLSAWMSNALQVNAIKSLFALQEQVLTSNNPQLIHDWRRLTTSDHFYYMCTKWFSDGDVHKYFSPNHTPHEAYVNFMNVLQDVRIRLETAN